MEDRCVCCGRVIPEGRMVCPLCERGAWEKKAEKTIKRKNGKAFRVIRYLVSGQMLPS